MPGLPHLILPRAEYNLPRRKAGYGRAPAREHRPHGRALSQQVDGVIAEFQQRRRPEGIDPNLILRVQLHPAAGVDEETWERWGLTLLSVDQNKTLVLFSSDADLSEFRRRLGEYQEGPPPKQKGAPHQQVFASINRISQVLPEDRIGRLLRSSGIEHPADIEEGNEYATDVELWDLGTQDANRQKVAELSAFIQRNAGRVTDSYVGESLVLLRVRSSGRLLRQVLELDNVAVVDLPPVPSLTVGELLDVGIDELAAVPAPGDGAPAIAVLDSGVASGHPLIGPAVGEATTIPRSLGDAADDHGHGTMVAGLALYGDVEQCIRARRFVPRLTLYSARVLNDRLGFDDERLITTQMREAIEYFRQTYGCRVFNASLGDERLPYRGGKVSAWASILDTLARELDVVIVVSAGNYHYDPGPDNPDGHIQDYPRYLLDDPARIIEPATGAIVVTVGALSNSARIPPGVAGRGVAVRPISGEEHPSPFTRSGPGLGDAIKPEFCDFGGSHAYDGDLRTNRGFQELSVISTNRNYLDRLFTTDVGTSFAAPRVAHVAARLYESFGGASANLIRALLAASASVPAPAEELLGPLGADAALRLCGYGRPRLDLAETSDPNRVVLYAESSLELDNFHIFEIPIPEDFVDHDGIRRITVALAYDPPVRHTRFDYLGIKMSFRLIRGRTVDEIAEAFRQRSRDEGRVDRLTSTKYDCNMEPKASIREPATLQKATFTMRRRPGTDYGDTYHLVVRCERKWARDEHGPQRYATTVVIDHSADVNLYNRIRERIREIARLRARA